MLWVVVTLWYVVFEKYKISDYTYFFRGKRFSMNFLDTLDSSDPKSWSGLSSPRSKKWSMQLRDSSQNSENSRNPSWVNNGRRGDHDRHLPHRGRHRRRGRRGRAYPCDFCHSRGVWMGLAVLVIFVN